MTWNLFATVALAAFLAVAPAAAADEQAVAGGMSLKASAFLCDSQPAGRSQRGVDYRLTHHSGDFAFWGDTAVVACGAEDADLENDGFIVADVSDPAVPRKVGALACVASASDIQIWKDLVFLAVDRNGESAPAPLPGPRYKKGEEPSCTDEPVSRLEETKETPIFQGVRVISIADPANPVLMKSIQTDRGAHTLTLLPDLEHRQEGASEPRLLLYATILSNSPTPDPQQVVEVPLDDPAAARKVGDFDPSPARRGCHDISVFEPRGLIVCTGIEEGSVLFDIRDDANDDRDDGAGPLEPRFLSHITNPFVGRRDHGAAFSWDGNTVVIGDENSNSLRSPACLDQPSPLQGGLWFYDVRDPRNPSYLAAKGPHPVVHPIACHPKQLNVIPLPGGRDVAVVSWLAGGTTLVDFTHVNHRDPLRRQPPEEVAHYIAEPGGLATGPTGENNSSFVWSAYWYNGVVYANNAFGCLAAGAGCMGTRKRGLDVFSLEDKELKTPVRLRSFNYPTQECLRPDGWAGGEFAMCER